MFSDLTCSIDVEQNSYPASRLTTTCENSAIRIYTDTIKSTKVEEINIGYCKSEMDNYTHCQQF